MSFLSYAQNFEDVLLWRALGHVKNGFYIDVGANDPVVHSVTKAFYDAGWHGINIEPLPAFHQAFMEQRPHDINLALAAGARDGEITLYDVPAVNGWASPERAVAEAHRAEGFEIAELTVPMRTLSGLCAQYVRGEIHFLKVDVEGFEGEVLRGMDLRRWRPWLLVIEATMPNSRVSNHAAWEGQVTAQGYRFAHFDGLNRYYAASEHSELLEVLSVQPNVFDDFIPYHLDSAWRATKEAGAAAEEAYGRLAQAADLQWKAEQRADNATSAAREALARCADLLAKYEDAHRRAAQAFEARKRVHADNAALREQLERASAQLEVQGAQLAAAHSQRAMAAADGAEAAVAARLDGARLRNAELQQRLARAAADGERALQWGRELEQRVLALQRSGPRRLAGAVRARAARLRRAAGAPLGADARARLKRLLRRALMRVLAPVAANERVRRLFIPLMRRYPGRAAQVSKMLGAIRRADPGDAPQVSAELQALPLSARRVLADLQRLPQAHGGGAGEP